MPLAPEYLRFGFSAKTRVYWFEDGEKRILSYPAKETLTDRLLQDKTDAFYLSSVFSHKLLETGPIALIIIRIDPIGFFKADRQNYVNRCKKAALRCL
ncbi:hypothetical protein C0674_07770 [Sporolactobacillus terrae]|uniref:Uncharacterized protein n=1 Tax=Sporolactobacillus terrae TaxID=269673 RepID=A0ABX5Q7C9_9BACL|nr:hypothetical protein C0674_07770 [Sporolactobacillus terrae]QAA25505.1 hypothetical protein C0679_07750 [Sporolactobacillus terrae]